MVRDDSDKKAVLLRSVISMARELNMRVVAEGIESEEDALELAKIGCSYGQSFIFGPPMGSDSVIRLLKERFPLTKRA
jgi:EAL domain-containing protein (putative c-di-GMP-specific phosphodiesterase class I)